MGIEHDIQKPMLSRKMGRAKLFIVIFLCFVKEFIFLCRIFDGIIITNQCGKGRKLGCAVPHGPLWVMLRYVMRLVDNILVVVSHALCPPICLLRSLAVAPSSKFKPLRMAFLPKRRLISSCASCIRRSLSSFACSS